MIRFVDCSAAYWPNPDRRVPCCGFLDTVTDRFVEVDGTHLFHHRQDFEGHPLADRLLKLVPDGFWEGAN